MVQSKYVLFSKLAQPRDDDMLYIMEEDYMWEFTLFGWFYWTVLIPAGTLSDGATSARDLGVPEPGWRGWWAKLVGWIMHSPKTVTSAWFVHDMVCYEGTLADGRPIPVVVASIILSIQLWRDGYRKEAFTWFLPTLFGGGGKCKENGLFIVRNPNG